MNKIIQHPDFQKWMGRLMLLLLVILMVLKWVFGWCGLWLCALFVLSLVAWSILSDFGPGMKDQ
jgi:hypothetical protein